MIYCSECRGAASQLQSPWFSVSVWSSCACSPHVGSLQVLHFPPTSQTNPVFIWLHFDFISNCFPVWEVEEKPPGWSTSWSWLRRCVERSNLHLEYLWILKDFKYNIVGLFQCHCIYVFLHSANACFDSKTKGNHENQAFRCRSRSVQTFDWQYRTGVLKLLAVN